MVSTRIALIFDFFLVIISLGANWLSAQPGSAYTAFDTAGMVGGYVGGQQTNPTSYTASDYGAYAWSALPPLIVGNLELVVALVALPLMIALAFFSFFRWQLALPAGILGVVGGLLWIGGISAIAQAAEKRLAGWQGFGGTPPQTSVGTSLGPYIDVVGGIALLFTYFLTKGERLDRPFDSSPPTPAS